MKIVSLSDAKLKTFAYFACYDFDKGFLMQKSDA